MRVLHVIRPAEGGMKAHLKSLVAGLRDLGCTVEVACPGDSALAAELKEIGLTVHPVAIVGPLDPVRDATCIFELRELLDVKRYDLAHFHGSKAGLVGRVAAVLARFKNIVVTAHNFVTYEEVPAAKKILFRYGESMLSHVSSRIITVSQALKDDLVKNYNIKPEKITPIYNGIDLNRFTHLPSRSQVRKQYGIGSAAVVIGTVARMAPQKGLNYLIEAIPMISRPDGGTHPETTFIIAGDGPLRPELERLAEVKGLRDKVRFPGYIHDIAEILACFDIFVIPSIAEGLSITTIEAMAAGLPVVASRVGGLAELVSDGVTGLLVEPRDPAALAQAIKTLVNDRENAVQLGLNGKNFAGERFSLDNMVRQTLQVYQTILAV